MTITIPIIALLLVFCVWMHQVARDAEAQAECWKREAQGWQETADRAMAERRNDIDARDALIEQLRGVRREYITHLAAGSCRNVAELRREIGMN